MDSNTQLTMSDCDSYKLEGPGVSLRYRGDIDRTQEPLGIIQALDAVDELRTLVQPLSAELELGCRYDISDWRDLDVDPKYRFWFIRQSSVPETIFIKPYFSEEAQISQAPELTREALTAWIEKAFQQQCPYSDTHVLAWNELRVGATRARIYDEKKLEGRNKLLVEVFKAGTVELPLERRDDGLWAYSPNRLLYGEPGIVYSITSSEFGLNLKINVHLSLWTEKNSKDNQAFQETMMRLIDKNWTLEYSNESFRSLWAMMARLRGSNKLGSNVPSSGILRVQTKGLQQIFPKRFPQYQKTAWCEQANSRYGYYREGEETGKTIPGRREAIEDIYEHFFPHTVMRFDLVEMTAWLPYDYQSHPNYGVKALCEKTISNLQQLHAEDRDALIAFAQDSAREVEQFFVQKVMSL
jgi:hypothetical protein